MTVQMNHCLMFSVIAVECFPTTRLYKLHVTGPRLIACLCGIHNHKHHLVLVPAACQKRGGFKILGKCRKITVASSI